MTTYSDTKVDLVINKLTKTQFDSASGLDPTQSYEVDPEFQGSKLLATDANGDIVETTLNPDDVQEKATIQVLQATDSITLADNTLYQGGTQTSLTIALPSSATVGFISQITFQSGSTPTTITSPVSGLVWNPRGEDIVSGVFTPVANKTYTVMVIYDGVQFVALTEGV